MQPVMRSSSLSFSHHSVAVLGNEPIVTGKVDKPLVKPNLFPNSSTYDGTLLFVHNHFSGHADQLFQATHETLMGMLGIYTRH
jgi:hypothetical protein